MEDLIQNAHTLFDERPTPSPSVTSPDVAETASTLTYSPYLSPDFPQLPEVHVTGPTNRYRPGLVDVVPPSSQFPFSLSVDGAMESRLTSSPTPLLSPLLGPLSPKTLREGVETTTQEQVIPVETSVNSTSAEAVSDLPTSVAEWRLHQLRLPPQAEAVTTPQSPPESARSSLSDFPLSSATSLQTGVGRFSP